MRKRNHPVYVRFSDQEYEQLLKKVKISGQTLQSYMLNTSLNGMISSADEVAEMRKKNKILEDMDRQLRGMGSNLNQMARTANSMGFLPTASELKSIASCVSQIKNEVNEEWRSTRQSISQQKVTVPCETASNMS